MVDALLVVISIGFLLFGRYLTRLCQSLPNSNDEFGISLSN
jgi:hypothetical protein